MHGPYECAGNVQELCAAKYLDQQQWWSYVKCQNFYGRSQIGTPDTALKCATVAKFDWVESRVGPCAGVDGLGHGDEGIGLLQESVKNTIELGIEWVGLFFVSGMRSLRYVIGKAARCSSTIGRYASTTKRGRNAR